PNVVVTYPALSAERMMRPAGTFNRTKRPSLSVKTAGGSSERRGGIGPDAPMPIGIPGAADLIVTRALRIASPLSAVTTRPVTIPGVSTGRGGESRAG